METVYKIRRGDGLFSTGGTYPGFSKKGKLWRQRGHVTSHLSQVSRAVAYNDCVVVTYEIVETEVDSQPVSEYIADIASRKERKAQDAKEALRRRKEEADRKLYEQLRTRFEDSQK